MFFFELEVKKIFVNEVLRLPMLFDIIDLTSLEETYEALRTFQILGIEKKPDVTVAACCSISKTIGSSSSTPKDLLYALKANSIAKCKINEKASQVLFEFCTLTCGSRAFNFD